MMKVKPKFQKINLNVECNCLTECEDTCKYPNATALDLQFPL